MNEMSPRSGLKRRGAAAPQPPTMLSHAAWVTHDVEATVEFYTKILGMELVSTVIDDRVPSTGDDFPYFHLFFRMRDGSTVAFFESPGVPERAQPSHPCYNVFDHFAMQVDGPEDVKRWHGWLKQNGVDVVGPALHNGLIMSIYFYDPNGLRLEITTPLDPDWNNHVDNAYADLDLWVNAKKAAIREGRDVKQAMIELTRKIRKERQPNAPA